jgi:hypothetical protein
MREKITSDLPRLLDAWRRSGVPVRSGVSLDQLRTFESQLGRELPQDLAAFYLTVDGMPDGVCDFHGIRFWRCEEIKPCADVPELVRTSGCGGLFLFADYSIWTHAYAIRVSGREKGSVALVGGPQPIPVAPSFAEFVSFYLEQPQLLFPPLP